MQKWLWLRIWDACASDPISRWGKICCRLTLRNWKKKHRVYCFKTQSQLGNHWKNSVFFQLCINDIFNENIHIKILYTDGISMLTASVFSQRMEAKEYFRGNFPHVGASCWYSRMFPGNVSYQDCLGFCWKKMGYLWIRVIQLKISSCAVQCFSFKFCSTFFTSNCLCQAFQTF